jgi:phage repressor protein C with HTH and peptisase S24 domain|tara:strand:- start:189408 stop:190139 length:732 start_codon:yes stop_codon:yes gene_type:complete
MLPFHQGVKLKYDFFPIFIFELICKTRDMYTHEAIWRAIDRLAKISGYSASGLAIKAGLDPTSFNKSKRIQPNGKARWPSMESISKVLSVTNTVMFDFVKLMEDSPPSVSDSPVKKPAIPVLGFAQAGRDGYFDTDGAPIIDKWGEVPLDNLMGDDLFALEVNGDSMLPLYRDGDLIIISQNDALKNGDRGVFKLANGEIMVKEVGKSTTAGFTLKSFNPEFDDIKLARKDVLWQGRVAWVSQ